MEIKQALNTLVSGVSLTRAQMHQVMHQVMTGQATPAQIGGLLVALRVKGETVEEITGAAAAMRELASGVELDLDNLVDTCGTGGDGANLFNVSTAAAFVAAAGGIKVAKHGNRSVTSTTGSADLLEAAGVNLALTPMEVARTVREVGVGFMFAPAHHGAMKHAIGPRKELGIRTVFNVLGPLTNPAGARRQVIGVCDIDLCRPLAEVLLRLGSEHVLVVHARSGLDEIALEGETFVAEMKAGVISEYTVTPEALGVKPASMSDLVVASASESLALIREALQSAKSERAQNAASLIALNAGAAFYVGGAADSLKQGVHIAEDIIASGLAFEKIVELAEFTACFAN